MQWGRATSALPLRLSTRHRSRLRDSGSLLRQESWHCRQDAASNFVTASSHASCAAPKPAHARDHKELRHTCEGDSAPS
eukprot:scaffold301_cov243-Pinguiococcus_pyrenoidosus.AAC.153